jgi:hypothetical protein
LPPNAGFGTGTVEKEVVVTKDCCDIIIQYPTNHLIPCGVAGCEVYEGIHDQKGGDTVNRRIGTAISVVNG